MWFDKRELCRAADRVNGIWAPQIYGSSRSGAEWGVAEKEARRAEKAEEKSEGRRRFAKAETPGRRGRRESRDASVVNCVKTLNRNGRDNGDADATTFRVADGVLGAVTRVG